MFKNKIKYLYNLFVGRYDRGILIYRMSHFCNKMKIKPLAEILRYLNVMLHGMDINPTAVIGKNIVIGHTVGLVIGSGVVIGDRVKLYQNVTLGSKENHLNNELEYPRIGNGVIIYPGSVVVGNISIGDNSIIGANSFVSKDIPSNAIVAGNPAKIIKMHRD